MGSSPNEILYNHENKMGDIDIIIMCHTYESPLGIIND